MCNRKPQTQIRPMENLFLKSSYPAEPVFPFPLPYALIGDSEDSDSFRQRRSKNGPDQRTATGNRVLLVGRIRELALYRAEVLGAHGFHVLTPQTIADALRVIRRNEFDIAVLTYTLSSDVVEELAEQVRQYCSKCPLIVISDSKRADPRISPDQTVLADDGPAALIAALRRVTRRS